MAVCSIWVSVGEGLVKNVHAPHAPYAPHAPQIGETVPYRPKIYGKPCTWWQELNLELSFETQSSL